MDLGLDGRVALVLGASHGLGRASAFELLREGAAVMLAARDEAALARASDEFAAQLDGGVAGQTLDPVTADDADIWLAGAREHRPVHERIGWVAGDVSLPSTGERLVRATVDRFGRLDVLVVNAGGPPPGPFESLTEEQWRQSVDLTFLSAVRVVRAAIPCMRDDRVRRSGGGRIVFIESSSIREPVANLVTSNSVRSAVHGLMKTLSIELAPDGILVNGVAPGRISTDRIRQLDADTAARTGRAEAEIRADQLRAIPLGRYGEPSELGGVVAFLASSRASYITGALVPVDGGKIRSMP
ncbi:MAG TPA: SDR family oxidoreductase [Candidatus Acidoferrales bacterium]|nr:SDR family oxidoreductase [Candidatus Acidoferrales bacterium]